jgi:glucokinase
MKVIGIDIGGTKCAVSLLREDGKIEEVSRFPTGNCSTTLARFQTAVADLQPSADPVFGISCGGPLDTRRGIILSPPNLPGWDQVPICDEFTRHFGGRAVLMNDANACALAEWQFGAGMGCRNMIFLTSGTGMGAGLILDGRLYEGASGDAGEAGHLRLSPDGPIGFGKAGSFEGFCSGGGIERLARLRLAGNPAPPSWADPSAAISTKKIAEAARAGEPVARKIMEEAGRKFGEALALLIDLLNPERIVIGGIFPRCADVLLPSLRVTLEREALAASLVACTIVPAALGETIGSHGAVAAALYLIQSEASFSPKESPPCPKSTSKT